MDGRDTATPIPSSADRQDMSPVKKALVEIRRLHRDLHDEREKHRRPLAIVGMGMRFPGGVSRAEDLARLLEDGRDAVGAVPRDRWEHDRYFEAGPPSPGKYYVDRGGFLGGVDLFDPEFFGIAPLEATTLDPQQRLILETAWEALEDAAIPVSSLRGSRSGVFLGIGTTDYHRAVMSDASAIDTYASTGTAFSVASGRIAYLMDLRGPALSVDTACSSSLVALHLACQSLRSGESDVALAGGVSLILSPEITINFCQAGMLSPDGRCKTFDASADGYVRSEGCGVVVLKRLDDALRAGDRVLAIVRGSAINQDGRSSGLTAPSGPAQEEVIRAALTNAGLTPDDIGYVEAHGTGTSLGDPIEVQALGTVFARGEGRPPLQIGSAKTNFGHMEAAAGMAGLMKTVLALQSGTIPPQLHFRTPNPHIAWADYDLEVTTRATLLEPTGGARRAGVSSFGFSGTNAHVVLEEPPALVARRVSRTETGAEGLTERSADPGFDVLQERPLHVLTLSAPHEIGLKALAGRYVAHLQDKDAAFPDICFTANSGRTHFDHRIAVVAGTADTAARALSAWLEGREAPELVAGGPDNSQRGTGTAFVFPALAPDTTSLAKASPAVRRTLDAWHHPSRGDAVLDGQRSSAHQHALAELWAGWGVRPDVVTGHGAGHTAAAVTAGLVRVEDLLRGDVAVPAGFGSADESGSMRAAALRYVVASRSATANAGREVVGDAASWRRATVDANGPADIAAALVDEDVGRMLIMGPADGIEAPYGTVVAAAPGPVGWNDMLAALARLYVSGADLDWRGVDEGHVRTKVSLPTYPFQRRRFWLERRPDVTKSNTEAGLRGGVRSTSADEASRGPEPWISTCRAAVRHAAFAPLDLNLASYPAKWAVLNELTRAVGRNAMASLGVFGEKGATASAADVIERHGVDPLYRRIVERWLQSLEADGVLVREGDGWTAPASLEPVDLAPLWQRVDAAMADNPALLAYVRNSAVKTEGVLTGRVGALETLFPDGSFSMASELYESATQLRYVNGIAAAALDAFVSARPAGTPVRVLEVGAGTGGTTSSLLPVLPAERSRYDYSDVSDVFLDWGQEKFASVPFLRTRRFDLETDPVQQGIEPGGYDVIVGSNVLHAVRDLRSTLQRVRSLLSPGGLLLLVESTGHFPWHDITTGLIEGWQHFADDLRDDTPLLPVDTWHSLLAEAGFRASAASPPADSPAAILRQHVILAVTEGRAAAVAWGAGTEAEAGLDPSPAPEGAAIRTGETAAHGPAATGTPAAPADALAQRLADAIGSEREDVVAEEVRTCVMEVLRSDPDRPPSKDARLMELGLDSLMAVRLRNVLQTRLGLDRLPSTLVFDHPTIRHIAALVLRLMADTPTGSEGRGDHGSGATEAGGITSGAGVAAHDDDDHRQAVAELSDEEAEARLLERLERDDL